MIHTVMAVQDLKARAFVVPFFVPTSAVGVRAFRDCANDPQHAFSRNPADYALFELGTFDDVTGVFTCGEMKTHGLASSYVFKVSTPAGTPVELREVA